MEGTRLSLTVRKWVPSCLRDSLSVLSAHTTRKYVVRKCRHAMICTLEMTYIHTAITGKRRLGTTSIMCSKPSNDRPVTQPGVSNITRLTVNQHATEIVITPNSLRLADAAL
jgi:phosphatidate phosphatase APP1